MIQLVPNYIITRLVINVDTYDEFMHKLNITGYFTKGCCSIYTSYSKMLNMSDKRNVQCFQFLK